MWVGQESNFFVKFPKHFFLLETSRNAMKHKINQGGSFLDAMNPKRLLKFFGYSQ